MPRPARIDAPGALHHIIIRGIDRKRIFFQNRYKPILCEEDQCLMQMIDYIHLN